MEGLLFYQAPEYRKKPRKELLGYSYVIVEQKKSYRLEELGADMLSHAVVYKNRQSIIKSME